MKTASRYSARALALLLSLCVILFMPFTIFAEETEDIVRSEYTIPEQYTKVKFVNGTYGFGNVDVIAAMTDAEDSFYFQFIAFDEDQALEGTVEDGTVTVTYDLSGFMTGDCQAIYDDVMASDAPWQNLTDDAGISRKEYDIPETYTKVKFFTGTYGFGEADIIASMTDDESAFYIQFICFDEEQILEGVVEDRL